MRLVARQNNEIGSNTYDVQSSGSSATAGYLLNTDEAE